jgi:hypothetical protein
MVQMLSHSRINLHKDPEINLSPKLRYLATIKITDGHKTESPTLGLSGNFSIGTKETFENDVSQWFEMGVTKEEGSGRNGSTFANHLDDN